MVFTSNNYFAFMFLLFATSLSAQSAETPVSLFHTGGLTARSSALVVNDAAVNQLRQETGTINLTDVPLITGIEADFILSPMPLFKDGGVITLMKDNGATETRPLPDIRTWYGTDPSDPSRALFVSADEQGQLKLMITGDKATSVTVIAPANTGSTEYEIIPANIPSVPFCGSEGLITPAGVGVPSSSPAISRGTRSDTLFEIELMIDVGYKLYSGLDGSDAQIADYLVDLFGAVNTIYQRDLKARFTVVDLVVWSTPDPFLANNAGDNSAGINTLDQLLNYREYIEANRTGVAFDLSHLIDVNPGFGGIAYLNVLRSEYQALPGLRTGVSNVRLEGDFPDINTYYWDTTVVAHELGHNVGSDHTHCYVPPIDCCYVDPNCSGCTTAVPASGTLMSYCHLQIGNGGSMTMVFHPTCITLMRPLIESSPMLAPYTDQSNILVEGEDGDYISNGSTEPSDGSLIKAQNIGGSLVTETFTIKNDGTLGLSLTGSPKVSISGSSLLTVSSQPADAVVAPGASTTFQVTFDPQTVGTHLATASIASSDPDTPLYSFVVGGRIVQPSEPITTTFTGNVPINEETGFFTVIPLTVENVPGLLTDLDVRFNGSNCANPTETGIQHGYIGDLYMRLIAPDETSVTLMFSPGPGQNGSEGDNFCNTLLNDDPSMPMIESITTAGAPYSGTYRPNEPLSTFNGGEPNGEWLLFIYDLAAPDQGIVRSFSLIIRGEVTATTEDWELYN